MTSTRRGQSSSRDLGPQGFGSQAGCQTQPSGGWLKTLGRLTSSTLGAGPRETTPDPAPPESEGSGELCNVDASRGHPGGLCGRICLTVAAIPGVSCGLRQAQPSHRTLAWSEWQGARPGWPFCCLSCCGRAALGSHQGGSRGPHRGGLQGRRRGSHWFGRIMSSKWNHSLVTVFHHLPTLNASRPGEKGGAWARGSVPSSASSPLCAPPPLSLCKSPALTSLPVFLGVS